MYPSFTQQIRLTGAPLSQRRFEIEWDAAADVFALAAFHAPRQSFTVELQPIDLELLGQTLLDCARAMRECLTAPAPVSPAKQASGNEHSGAQPERDIPVFLRATVRAAEDCQ